MTQDDIIRMAAHADREWDCDRDMFEWLETFAEQVRDDYSNKHAKLWLNRIDAAVKAEREACARVAEYRFIGSKDGSEECAWKIAAAIRARK